jgi:hypothetical protein
LYLTGQGDKDKRVELLLLKREFGMRRLILVSPYPNPHPRNTLVRPPHIKRTLNKLIMQCTMHSLHLMYVATYGHLSAEEGDRREKKRWRGFVSTCVL